MLFRNVEYVFSYVRQEEQKEQMEEERRLCYVGITRARKKLHLTYAEKRRVFGRDEERRISRFLREIPEHLIEEINRKVNIRFPKMDSDVELDGYCLGQRVLHPKFGEGTVIDHEGMGERSRVHVRFDMHGSKWLALAYAKLEPA